MWSPRTASIRRPGRPEPAATWSSKRRVNDRVPGSAGQRPRSADRGGGGSVPPAPQGDGVQVHPRRAAARRPPGQGLPAAAAGRGCLSGDDETRASSLAHGHRPGPDADVQRVPASQLPPLLVGGRRLPGRRPGAGGGPHVLFLGTHPTPPARQALVPRLVAREDLTNAIALNALVFNGSRIIGPPIGGLIYAAAGPAAAFLANAVSYLAVIYALAIMRLQPRPEEGPRPGLWADLREGLVYVWSQPIVRTLLLLVAMIGSFAFSYLVLMPVMTTTVLGGGAKENGYLLGIVGVGATSGALLVAAAGAGERPGQRLLALSAVAGGALLTFSLSRTVALSGAVLFIVGMVLIAFLSTANATIQNLVPDALRGRVMSVYALALIGSGPLNSLLAGVLGNYIGAPRAIAVSALLILLPVAVLALRARALLSFAPEA